MKSLWLEDESLFSLQTWRGADPRAAGGRVARVARRARVLQCPADVIESK
ncbi:MAG: hypothetical protein GXP40_05490 [Chloroflexi bacterium]|nr:hypothetical protein [Chloroflexota bacterium]